MSDTVTPAGYDFFADVEGTRSVAHTLEAGIRFQTLLNSLARLEQSLYGLPSRLQALHERGLAVRSTLGEEVARQNHRLKQAATQAREVAEKHQQTLTPRVVALWQQIEENDAHIGADGYAPHAERIAAALQESSELKTRMEAAESAIHDCFSELANDVRSVEQRVAHLERVAESLARATFTLRPGEALVDAVEGTYHPSVKETAEGVLFLTEQRLIFEQRQEVTSRARFLPFSKSRRVDEVRFDESLEHLTDIMVSERQGADTLVLTLHAPARTRTATFALQARVQAWHRLLQEARERRDEAVGR